MNLYELTQEYIDAQRFFSDCEEINEQVIADTLEGLEGEIEQKCIATAAVIANLTADANAKTEAAQKMQARARAADKKVKALRESLARNMEAAGICKVENTELTLRLNKPRKRVVIDNENDLPESVIVYKSSVDKAAVKRLLDSGEALSGAHLEDGDYSVAIK